MNISKRPEPLFSAHAKKTPVCPVCGHPSYSRDGIHPQCARQHADEERIEKRKSMVAKENNVAAKTKMPSEQTLKPWHKRCPKCQIQVHVRRSTCKCGFRFSENNTIRTK